MTGPILSWYGDDFTGAAAVMQVMASAGVPSVLFLDPPAKDDLSAFPEARAIGIAGSARARSPDWMRAELPAIFVGLKAIGADLALYKICSTLDSSPHTGSIGCAIEIALQSFQAPWVPVLTAAPPIGRWQAFGTLFARSGDHVYRLDRHPVMSCHPVTPMLEADVARHLSQQTSLGVSCITLPELGEANAAALARAKARLVTIDCVSEDDLLRIGALLWSLRGPEAFVVGSQGVAYAIAAYLGSTGRLPAATVPLRTRSVDRIAVVSGSVSEVTAAQIAWAEANGFGLVAFDPASVTEPTLLSAAIGRATVSAIAVLKSGRSVLVHSVRGPRDPRIPNYRAALAGAGLNADAGNRVIGEALGDVLATILRETGISRAVISGGDTSSHALRKLGVRALAPLAETAPGAALNKAYLRSGAHLEIAMKGGQMGTADYFGRIRAGGGNPA